MTSQAVRTLFAGLGLASVSGLAVADSFPSDPGTWLGHLAAMASTNGGSGGDYQDADAVDLSPGSKSGSVSSQVSGTYYTWYGALIPYAASGSVSASADIGRLGLIASTQTDGETRVSASGQAGFLDWLKVTGPADAWVTFEWTLQLHVSHGCTSGGVNAGGGAVYDYGAGVFNARGRGVGGRLSTGLCGEQTLSRTEYLWLQTGDVVRLTGGLEVYASGGNTMDASHTARMFLDVKDPNFGFESASGFRYTAAAVPEPGTYALMALGLAALAVRIRARRPQA